MGSLLTIPFRVLTVRICNNTGRSVFGFVVFHAMITMSTYPDYGIRYDPVVTSIILEVIVAFILVLRDTRTLARFRKAYHLPVH